MNYDDFKKLDLAVAVILEAERIENSEKLLKLRVDLGGDLSTGSKLKRQIIAGIGKQYAPENLIGRQIVVVVNLEPKTLMGLESQGMLLAADTAEGPVLLQPEKDVPTGTKIC